MAALSVVVITLNEAAQIGRCLDSVRAIADEIVILDSGSTDDTVKIAQECGATVHSSPFSGYIEQKNKALQYATHSMVLCLDADEALDETLISSIQTIKAHPEHRAYRMNRCTNYCGTFIRHGSWYPDSKIRLFDKRIAQWGGINPHDKVIVEQGVSVGTLKGDILHYSYRNMEEHILQNNRFSTIAARQYYQSGKKAGVLKLWLSPAWAFIHSFIVRGGFRDGFLGLVIARNIAHLTFMKYYKLIALQRGINVN